MRRRATGCFGVAATLVIAVVLVRMGLRHRVVELAEMPDAGGFLSMGLWPLASNDQFLVLNRGSNQLQRSDLSLTITASIPAPSEAICLVASRDLSIAVVLEYRGFSIINTRTKEKKFHALEKMSTEAFLSSDGTRLWIGEYETGVMHRYTIVGLDATRIQTANPKAEAERLLGPPIQGMNRDFRIAAVVDESTYLYSEGRSALFRFNWKKGAHGSVPLPGLHSHPTFVQSLDGNRLAIVSNRLVFVDLVENTIISDSERDDYSAAGDFNSSGDRFFVAYSAPAMLPIPFTHRGGQIDEFDLQGNRLRTWHSKANRIHAFGTRGPVTWMVADEGFLRTIRLP